MNNNLGILLGCIGVAAVGVLLVVVSAILNGFVISVMWTWFVVPVFRLPALSVVQSIGLAMIVSVFIKDSIASGKNNGDSASDIAVKVIVRVVVSPLLTLFIAWVVTLFL